MTFQEFLDVKYVEANLKLQVSYDVKAKSQTLAVVDLISYQRHFFKWIFTLSLTYAYLKALILNDYPSMPELIKTTEAKSATKPTEGIATHKESVVSEAQG